jgi:hypothetical protein
VNVDVPMTAPEMMQGGLVGLMRRVGSMKAPTRDRYARKSSWSTDIDSAIAEMAVSKYRGIYWIGHRNSGADLTDGREVRATIYEDGHLLLHETDRDDRLFVLVVAKPPVYSIRGQILALNGKIDDYWRPARGEDAACWWVPQGVLVEF